VPVTGSFWRKFAAFAGRPGLYRFQYQRVLPVVPEIIGVEELVAGIHEQFVELDSRNHVLLEDEPAWSRFQEAVLEFAGLGGTPRGEDPVFARLTSREREILSLISRGLANADIGESLKISEKTVRNHVSNLFDKLGVWTRAQVIVFARDHGFRS